MLSRYLTIKIKTMQKMMKMKMIMLILVILAAAYAGKGIVMHQQVVVEEAAFHALQATYWSQAKSVRDAAQPGSELNNDLVAIKNYPSDLLRLKLVGVGRILVGIFVLLFAILLALMVMPVRLAMMINKKK